MNTYNDKFISIFDTKDRGFATRNYCEGVEPPKKHQITGKALKYMINFINECLKGSEDLNEFKKSRLERQ